MRPAFYAGAALFAAALSSIAFAQTLGRPRSDELREILGNQPSAGSAAAPDLEAQYQQRLTHAKSAQQGARALADEVLKRTAELEQEAVKWNERLAALLQNDDGRAIAGDPGRLTIFRRMRDVSRFGTKEADAVRARTKSAMVPVDQAIPDPKSLYVPSPALLEQLNRDRSMLDTQLADYRTAESGLSALVRQGSASPRSTQTLREALQRIEEDEALTRAAAQAEAESRRKEEEQAAVRARAEREAEQARAAKEEKERVAAEEAERHAAILRKANDREYQKVFISFLSRAHTRVGRGHGMYKRNGAYPAAYTDIEEDGGFASEDNLARLVERPDGVRRKRPKGDPDRARDFFIDFEEVARVWVAQCKLLYSPDDAGKPCTPKTGEGSEKAASDSGARPAAD